MLERVNRDNEVEWLAWQVDHHKRWAREWRKLAIADTILVVILLLAQVAPLVSAVLIGTGVLLSDTPLAQRLAVAIVVLAGGVIANIECWSAMRERRETWNTHYELVYEAASAEARLAELLDEDDKSEDMK